MRCSPPSWPKHLDVPAFARYLALQELVGNFDDIDGPGNNSYLRYDEGTKLFTVLSWDLNLAFNARPAGGRMPPGGQAAPAGGAPRAGGPGGPGGRSNVLVQRFQANAGFAALYDQAKVDLKAQLFTSGTAALVLDRWAGVLTHAGDLVDAATVQREAANISRSFA